MNIGSSGKPTYEPEMKMIIYPQKDSSLLTQTLEDMVSKSTYQQNLGATSLFFPGILLEGTWSNPVQRRTNRRLFEQQLGVVSILWVSGGPVGFA